MSVIVELAKSGVLRNKNFRTEEDTKSFFCELHKADENDNIYVKSYELALHIMNYFEDNFSEQEITKFSWRDWQKNIKIAADKHSYIGDEFFFYTKNILEKYWIYKDYLDWDIEKHINELYGNLTTSDIKP